MFPVVVMFLLAAVPARSQPVVKTPLGNVLGSYCDGTNNSVVRFIGIPYAKPPVGDLRWKAPHKYETAYSAQGYSATVAKPYCPQIPGDFNFYKAVNQSEDCLYLNVWAPANAKPSSKLPVRVYIHGGGFTVGGGIDPTYDGCQVVEDGAVVAVTLNYRLGMLGFMALPEFRDSTAGNTTGNWGLLDQRLALQWVQENIAAFGGDPKRVLIHGQSSGATAVYLHTLMPASRGLFHKAVMHSGDFDFAAVFLKDAYHFGSVFQDYIGCNKTSARARGFASPRECMLAATVADIKGGQAYLEFQVGVPPGATVDGSPFAIPEHPHIMMNKGAMARVPTVIGCTANEGGIFALLYTLQQNTSVENMTQQQFQNFVLSTGEVPNSYVNRVLAQYDPQYFGSYFVAAAVASDDVSFFCPMYRTASAFSRFTRTSGYFLQPVNPNSGCGIISSLGIDDMPPQFVDPLGAYHTYDLQFSFELPYGTPAVRYNCSYSANEALMAAFMSGIWSSFAARGTLLPPRTKRPTGPQLAALKDWPRWTSNSSLVMALNFTQPTPFDFTEVIGQRCALWDQMLMDAIRDGTHFPDLYPPAPPSRPPPKRSPPPKRQPPKRSPPRRPPPRRSPTKRPPAKAPCKKHPKLV